MTESEARDVLFAASAPELYELLVLRQGWSAERYGSFVADAMIAALLASGGDPSEAPGPTSSSSRRRTSGSTK